MHERDNSRAHDAEGSEEGEIVDSEEEQDMIQRIRELEAKNDELEKIASISGDYTNQFSYATECQSYKSRVLNLSAKKTLMNLNDVARIPSDASSISSEEIEPVKKLKRRGKHLKKGHGSKSHSRSNSSHKHVQRSYKFKNNIKLSKPVELYRKQKKIHLAKENSPIFINDNYLETISLDSDEDSVIDMNISNCGNIETSFQLNRDKLRLALAHDKTNEIKTTGNLLKERLYNGNALVEHKENLNTCDIVPESPLDVGESENKSQISEQSLDHSDKEECATNEEQELRLIALKSAILKKHLARKKRNAEMAYSPTDFAPVPVNFSISDDNMDVVEEELNDVMEISPINSPKLVLTPNEREQSQNDFKEDNPNKNGVESVLQKALRRLKSNRHSPNSSLNENDSRTMKTTEDFLNSPTIMVEIATSNTQNEQQKVINNKVQPNMKEESGPYINETKHISLENSATLDEINKVMSLTDNIPVELNTHKTEESDTCSNLESESNGPKAQIGSENIAEDSPSDTNQYHMEEIRENSNDDISVSNKKDNESNEAQMKESSDGIKLKLRPINSSSSKSIASNENSKTKESVLKKKRLNSVTASPQPSRAQPLSVKNNLLPSRNASPKGDKMIVQATLNKMRTTRTTKIVRRNKVINKEITTKIKRSLTPVDSHPSKVPRTIVNTSAKTINTAIAASDTPKITVKKLIINLRASDTETSDDEILREVHPKVDPSVDRIKNTYSEIASPLELLMNSASSSPVRNKNFSLNETPTSVTKETIKPKTNTATNEAFEQKLDAFLKGIRKKGSLETSINQSPKSSPVKKVENDKSFNTPSAVRHLPLASQDEYRRLVHRMTLLEKQKQTKKPDNDSKTTGSTSINIPQSSASIQHEDKIVAKRNAELKTLLSYENAFEMTSDNIVKLLNKSLSLVADAKKAKIAKLRYEKRLQELRAELARVETLFGQEERKFLRMKPQIGASNQFLTTLKKKRRNIMENANKLGKSLQGDKYRINNKVGEEIIAKSRKLDAEIKLVNILKTDNIETFLSVSKSTKDYGDCDDQSSVKAAQLQSNNKKDNEIENCNQAQSLSEVDVVPENSNQEDKEPNSTEQHSFKGTQKEMDSQENYSDQNQTSTEIMEEKDSENQTCERGDVSESETPVELEVQHEDNTAKESNDKGEVIVNSETIVPVYESPLDHFRHGYRNIDFNAIVCPFEMWGECADGSCSYMHMTIGRKRGTELTLKPLNADNLLMNGAL